jgi:hypothetical protein
MSASAGFSSHDPRVISVFEIVSAYFTDTVFNHVHHSAKTNLIGGSSLTDEYVRRIQAYVIGVKNDGRCYSDVVQGVHTYFTSTTRFTTLSFAEFVDRIVGVCVPEEYFRQFSPQDKDELLSSVLCDLVSNLAAFATRADMLRRIIDGHATTPEVTIRMLQDAAVNSLITKRATLHNKFLRKMGQARDTVSMDVIDDMKKALRRLVKEKAEAVTRAEEAEDALGDLKKQLRDAKQREAKMLKLVELLRRGREEGAAAVGLGLRVPRRDTLAEADDPLDVKPRRPPRRERIAERRVDEDDDDDEDDEDEEDDDEEDDDDDEDDNSAPPTRRGRAQSARTPAAAVPLGIRAASATKPAVAASFFKTNALSGGAGFVTAAQLQPAAAKKAPQAPEARPQAPEARPQAPEARPLPEAPPIAQRPTNLSSFLENIIDTSTGDSELDNILYGDS